jgi:hypothetical protein
VAESVTVPADLIGQKDDMRIEAGHEPCCGIVNPDQAIPGAAEGHDARRAVAAELKAGIVDTCRLELEVHVVPHAKKKLLRREQAWLWLKNSWCAG